MNQLQSIYKRFNEMINKSWKKKRIQNVFVIVDAAGMNRKAHFINNDAAYNYTNTSHK